MKNAPYLLRYLWDANSLGKFTHAQSPWHRGGVWSLHQVLMQIQVREELTLRSSTTCEIYRLASDGHTVRSNMG